MCVVRRSQQFSSRSSNMTATSKIRCSRRTKREWAATKVNHRPFSFEQGKKRYALLILTRVLNTIVLFIMLNILSFFSFLSIEDIITITTSFTCSTEKDIYFLSLILITQNTLRLNFPSFCFSSFVSRFRLVMLLSCYRKPQRFVSFMATEK